MGTRNRNGSREEVMGNREWEQGMGTENRNREWGMVREWGTGNENREWVQVMG